MIPVQEAEDIIFENIAICPEERVFLTNAYGAVLREDIFSDRDQPSFNKSLMDGAAISYNAWQDGRREFKLDGVQAAGQPIQKLTDPAHCFEIMTGAVVPEGCDCVIPVEHIDVDGNIVEIKEGYQLKQNDHIRPQGSDQKKGDRVLQKGSRLLAPQIAIAASVGKARVKVSHNPTLAIVSTGDELVDINKPVKEFQIRKSNSYALQCMFALAHLADAKVFHIKDNKRVLFNRLAKILKTFDVVVLCGGVSMGKFDYVPGVLAELKVRVLFHKVSQRPGKPFWFGKTKKGTPVFALPGNPISTQVCAARYITPYLKIAAGLDRNAVSYASLAKDHKVSSADFTNFLPVQNIITNDGKLLADPKPFTGSGDFAALADTDGFIEIPAGMQVANQGLVFKYYSWK